MAENIVTIPKKKRYPNGIVHGWSVRKQRMLWGFDAYINERRIRRLRYDSRELAETELRILQLKGDCERYGLPVDDAETEIPEKIWQRFETVVECKIGAIGATAELLVAADLLRRGYDVYRSVASNADCDLIVGRYKKLCRIEVKSAVVRDGYVRFKSHRMNLLAHDVLALCFLRDFRIEYRPPIERWFDERVE